MVLIWSNHFLLDSPGTCDAKLFMITTGIILAAGRGKRMQSNLPKPLHKVTGLALVDHTVRIMRIVGIQDITIVVSPALEEALDSHQGLLSGVKIVVQSNELGTADAMISARSSVGKCDSVVVAPVDMVLITTEILRELIAVHNSSNALATVMGARVEDPTGLGRIRLDNSGNPERVVEDHELNDDLVESNLVNTAWYCFSNSWVWDQLNSVAPATETGEMYLPRVIEYAHKTAQSRVVISEDSEVGMGVNDRIELAKVEAVMRRRINYTHMANGVSLKDPANTYIDIDVEIGRDTSIGPGSHIGIRSKLGSNVVIGPNTQIIASNISDDAVVDGARIHESFIGKGVYVGANSLIRNGAEVHANAKVGNLAEIKNSVIGVGSSVSHFSYLGDATVGAKVNIGAGTVTCNYDGKGKHETVIEHHAMIGSSTMIVAPVNIGVGAKTGAGSVVRNDVPAGDTVAGVPAKSIKFKNKK